MVCKLSWSGYVHISECMCCCCWWGGISELPEPYTAWTELPLARRIKGMDQRKKYLECTHVIQVCEIVIALIDLQQQTPTAVTYGVLCVRDKYKSQFFLRDTRSCSVVRSPAVHVCQLCGCRKAACTSKCFVSLFRPHGQEMAMWSKQRNKQL